MIQVLSVQNLTKVYPGKQKFTAVDGISFHLNRGEILGLLGPNGSGKTTTIQMLLGTLTASAGTIFYFGKDFAKHRSETLQQVSFASTYTSMPFLLTLEENLEVFGALYGYSRSESAKRFNPLLERFGVLDKKKERVSKLSAGQVTRLMLVKAFFITPKIVLLDEPTASLDPEIASDICSFILEQRQQHGTSILFTSHKMGEVMEICDRTVFLKNGKIIADDFPEKLAKSVSAFRIRLTIIDGMKRIKSIADRESLKYTEDHRNIEIVIEEEKIPGFLNAVSQANISYATIRIEEPSLEDFFFQISKKEFKHL